MTVFDLDRTLRQTEDFLRRHLKSKAVKEAEKRRQQRQMQEAGRRVARAATMGGASGVGVAAYALAISPIGATGLAIAGAATLIAATSSLFWPSRRQVKSRRKLSSAELSALLADVEEWLLRQRPLLPGRALPSMDIVFARIDDLRPHMAEINPNGTLAWEIRRLLADHLPRLIQAFCELPALVRDTDESRQRLINGLGTVGSELARLCLEASHERLLDFETQGTFLEARYRDRIGSE